MKEQLPTIKNVDELIDAVEATLITQPQVDCPVVHRFTPGLYIREVFIPKGTYLTSKIHNTEHPYVVSMGKIAVYTEKDLDILIIAPYTGITKPGTRRVLYAHEDTIWTTFHPTNKTTVEEVEAEIIQKRENKFITGQLNKEIEL